MLKTANLSRDSSLRLAPQQSLRRMGLCSQIVTGQQTSPIVFPEKRTRGKASKCADISMSNDDSKKAKGEDHRIDIGDEQSDLLGYEVFAGKLILDKRKPSKNTDTQTSAETSTHDAIEAKLTSKALLWGTQMLCLEDVISVSFAFSLVA